MQTSAGRVDDQDNEIAEGIIESLLGQADPLARYQALTRAQSVYEALTRQLAAERARAVGEMHSAGLTYGQIAEVIGFTRARAQQLVEAAAHHSNKQTQGH